MDSKKSEISFQKTEIILPPLGIQLQKKKKLKKNVNLLNVEWRQIFWPCAYFQMKADKLNNETTNWTNF